MNAAARRQAILELLRHSSVPVSASALAGQFSVSRQIIVGDIALLRAQARSLGIKDIRQKGEDVFFVLTNLNFEAVGSLCADPDYKARVVFQANAKEPTLKLRLAPGSDSLKQSKVFVKRYQGFCS